MASAFSRARHLHRVASLDLRVCPLTPDRGVCAKRRPRARRAARAAEGMAGVQCRGGRSEDSAHSPRMARRPTGRVEGQALSKRPRMSTCGARLQIDAQTPKGCTTGESTGLLWDRLARVGRADWLGAPRGPVLVARRSWPLWDSHSRWMGRSAAIALLTHASSRAPR